MSKKNVANPEHLAAVPAGTSPARTAAEIRLWEALAAHPSSTSAELAAHAGAGRSTATKVLARWDAERWVTRSPGNVTGGRRVPDHWAVAARPSNGLAERGEPGAAEGVEAQPGHGGDKRRLPKGALRGLVEDFLREPDRVGLAYTPGEIGRKLGRSSGAVSNCLDRLADHGTVLRTSQKPRRFALPEEASAE